MYLLIHGFFHWAIIGLIIILTDERFNFAKINPAKFSLKILIFATIGIIIANTKFLRNEKTFLSYLSQDKDIDK